MLSDNGAPIGDAREAEGSRRLASEEGEGSALKSDAEAVADKAFRQDSASTSTEPDSLPQSAEPAADKDAVAPAGAGAGAGAGAAAAETATEEAAAGEAHAHVGDGAPDAGDTGGANPSGGGHPAGNSARTSSNPPQTGDGDASQQQTAPAAPSSSTSARAMVPDEEDDGNQPKHVTLQNYASRDSGAALLESSPASKGMTNLLLDSKDKYAISPCEEKQWAVLGLSEDILVRTLVIGSHEKYSSLLKEFQVLASQTYPVHEWLDLGTFTAKFVQGEQTFEIPQPAFARYLKFKFLSHYGDEFYCTVSQVKVHGSTMLESFQHEWQRSSAEVREVQDFMKKKDPKPSSTAAAAAAAAAATAARTPGRTLDSVAATDALPSQGSGTEGGGSDGAIGTNNTSPRTPGSAPRPSGAGTAPSNDGTVEHRPHAASAAAVSPGGKGGGGVGASGAAAGGGSGTATVEDIVRGVPAEMVVPTTTAAACVGPTGSDGACRGEVLADRAAAQEAGGTAADNGAPLGAEMPTMGGTAPSGTGKPDGGKDVGGGDVGGWAATGGGDRGGNGDGTMDIGGPHARGDGVDVEGIKGAAALPGSDEHVGDTQTAGGQQGPVEGGVGPGGRTEGGNKMNSGAMDGPTAAVAAGAGAQGSVSAGSGAGVGDVVTAGDEGYDGQGGGQEAPPQPRKGIIHSTMEAISKVVHRGEGSKLKDDDAAAAAANPGEATAAKISGDGEATAAASSGGSLEGDSKIDRPDPPDSTRVTAPATGAADGSGPVGDAGGELHTTGVWDSSDTAVESVGSSAAVSGDSVVRGDGSSAHGSAGGAVQNPGSPGDRAGANEGISAEAVPARVTEPVESGVSGVSNASSVSGADRAGEDARVEGGGAQRVEPDAGGGGGGGGDGAVAERGNEAKQASGGSTSSPQPTDGQQQAQNTVDATAAAADGGTGLGGADHAPPATAPPAAKDDDRLPSQAAATAAVATAGGDVKAQVQNTASIVVQEGGGSRDSGPSSMPVAPLDEASATELSAACLDAPSFSEFREEVLARTQQAQQSAGGAGGVAIGGQYESIFKTLMNKIKTLEINQSLFGLYIDDVHGCYQDVIAKMLQEQHRARASRSELLNAQTAHLAQIGDQWPAFQELQAKVIEVENRMLLSSLAWFTSLLCLVILVSSCCFKTFRRYALGGGSGDGSSGSRRGRRRKGACDSCSPSRGSATMCPESNGTVDTASPPMKETLHW